MTKHWEGFLLWDSLITKVLEGKGLLHILLPLHLPLALSNYYYTTTRWVCTLNSKLFISTQFMKHTKTANGQTTFPHALKMSIIRFYYYPTLSIPIILILNRLSFSRTHRLQSVPTLVYLFLLILWNHFIWLYSEVSQKDFESFINHLGLLRTLNRRTVYW